MKEAVSFKNYLELHFIVFLWGFTAILGKLISIPAVELVFVRTLLAAVALALILYFRKISFNIGRQALFRIMGVGFIIAAHWILFFASARVSSVAICLAGMSTVSLWTAILEPMFTRKKIQPHEIFMAVLIILGLYLIFQFEIDQVLGIVMAVVSAALSAVFSIVNARLVKSYRPAIISCYEMAGACLATALFFPVYARWFTDTGQLNLALSWLDVLWLLILAIVCTVYPFTASVRLMKKISAFTVNLSINLEPVYGILFAYFIFKDAEKMSGGFYLGAVIILFSVFSHALIERYLSRRHQFKAPPATPGTRPETLVP